MMRTQRSDRAGQARQGESPRDGTQPQDSEGRRGQAQATDQPGDLQARAGQRGGNPQDQTGDPQADRQGRAGAARGEPNAQRPFEPGPPSDRGQEARDSGSPDGRGGIRSRGPFNDDTYGPWSQRLRDVQEMLPEQDLRERMARIWDTVRSIRAESKRHSQEPQWDQVQNQVIDPLVELRQQVSERLAQLQSDQALVPIDRDPVPDRFTDLVRTYFENLGQGEP